MPRNKSDKAQIQTQEITYGAQRVGVFIDVQNMYYSAKNLFGAKVNFINVVKGAIRGRQLIRAIAYVVETPQQHEVRFLDALRLQGIELKERDLQVFSSGVKKADWDVGIAVDAIRMSDILDVIVLISGDGDYLPLVEYLQNKGRRVEVMAFRNTASSRLVELVDRFTDLADDGESYMISTHHRSGKPNMGEEESEGEDVAAGDMPGTELESEALATPSTYVHPTAPAATSAKPSISQPPAAQRKFAGRSKRTIM